MVKPNPQLQWPLQVGSLQGSALKNGIRALITRMGFVLLTPSSRQGYSDKFSPRNQIPNLQGDLTLDFQPQGP